MTEPDAQPPHVHESELRRALQQERDLALTQWSSSVLAVAIDRASGRIADAEDAVRLRRVAAIVAAIRGFRFARAGVAVVEAGYELEADAYVRGIVELLVDARAAVHDASGAEARRWLEGGRERGISGRIRRATGTPDVYRQLSRAAHGEPRAIVALAAGAETVEWGPRRTERCEKLLLTFALSCRDLAVLLEEAGYPRVRELDELDVALAQRVPGWRPDADWDALVDRSRDV
jgi:hypothetical protein